MERSKRQKRPKTYVLVDFEDGFDVLESKKLNQSNLIKGAKIQVIWGKLGAVWGTVFGLSDSKTALLMAHKHGVDYQSDNELENDDGQVEPVEHCQAEQVGKRKRFALSDHNSGRNGVLEIHFSHFTHIVSQVL